jgi:hypothetical protein
MCVVWLLLCLKFIAFTLYLSQISFLSGDFKKAASKKHMQAKFDVAYFSNNMVHYLSPTTTVEPLVICLSAWLYLVILCPSGARMSAGTHTRVNTV